MRPNRFSRAGFTLIEVLIAVLVISIIAAITIPNFLGALQRGRQRRTMADMRTLSTAVESYLVDFSRPPQSPDLAALIAVLQPIYVRVLPEKDGWSNDFAYSAVPWSYSVESYGRDGLDGANITPQTRDEYDLDILLANGIFVASPD